MSDSSTIHRIHFIALLVCLLLGTFPLLLFAQDEEPPGESTSESPVVENTSVDFSTKELIVSGNGPTFTWSPPKGRDIIYAAVKTKDPDVIIIALDDGSVYKMTRTAGGWGSPVFLLQAGPEFVKMVGDAVYGVTNAGQVFVSRDTARTWQIDSAGLGSGYSYDIALDTLQYVYLANSTGLFKQHPDSSIWHRVASFPVAYTNAVFVDRKNRILAASSKKAYISTDGGSTWNIDTAGLRVTDVLGLSGFCDDKYGNLYARSATGLWRSTAGTQSWTRIDQPISSSVYDPSTNVVFNSLNGDSLLYAATVYGGYRSSDQGTTWVRDSSKFKASFIYGLAKTPAGRLLTSTNLGVYYKNPGDLQWTKTFPTSGFLAACPIFLDGSGNAYALGAKLDPTNFQSLRGNWKSTNGGLTWNPDTAGLGGLTGQLPAYFVDEIGTQHYGGYGSPQNFYRKVAGQNWTPDTSGYGNRPSDYALTFGTDHHGFLYVATNSLSTYKGMVWKRPITGGTWIPDTTGLAGEQIYSLTADKSGNTIAGGNDGVFRKNGGVWTKLPSPPALSGYSAFVVSVDSSGNTIAGFSTYGFPNYLWRGLYATKNNGTTWTYLGLDSISVRGLVSYGDSTYAYTYADGLYKVRSTTGVSFVGATAQPTSFALEQNYPNPFNPTTTIRFSISKLSIVHLKIFDILGRDVETLVNGEMNSGSHQISFDATPLASGIYFYRLQAGDFTATKKLVLLK